ncbi:hypothetical protein ACHAPG_005978 [Botrytis cinerea]
MNPNPPTAINTPQIIHVAPILILSAPPSLIVLGVLVRIAVPVAVPELLVLDTVEVAVLPLPLLTSVTPDDDDKLRVALVPALSLELPLLVVPLPELSDPEEAVEVVHTVVVPVGVGVTVFVVLVIRSSVPVLVSVCDVI